MYLRCSLFRDKNDMKYQLTTQSLTERLLFITYTLNTHKVLLLYPSQLVKATIFRFEDLRERLEQTHMLW